VRFWDSSALVPLLVSEQSSIAVTEAYAQDADVMAWWATRVECVSALARLEREGPLAADGMAEALRRLAALEAAWIEVQPGERVRQLAVRLLRVHDLRAGDALQLAAALVGAADAPSELPFVTLDQRLGRAADREGLPVLVPGSRS
jgi:predicted nucleic acid-binding protein